MLPAAAHFALPPAQIPGGVGAYSDSRGALAIRKEARAPSQRPAQARAHSNTPRVAQVAQYIKDRDGLKDDPNPDHIFLTGASSLPHHTFVMSLSTSMAR